MTIEKKLNGRDVDTVRPEKGISDQEVLQQAIDEDVPILTRDQGDYVKLDNQLEHPGIMIDKEMHLRDRKLVAETICSILNRHKREFKNAVVFISNFFGR